MLQSLQVTIDQILNHEKIDPKKVDWFGLTCNTKISPNLLSEYPQYIIWDNIFWLQSVPEKTIIECEPFINKQHAWGWVGKHQFLSENFIRHYIKRLNLKWIVFNDYPDTFVTELSLKGLI